MTLIEVERQSGFSSLMPSELHKAQHRAGQELAASLLARYRGDSEKNIVIKTDEKGKPFTDDLCLSIAHSGELVCAAVSDLPIGVDIEILRAFDERIAARFFYPGERKWLTQAENEERRRERFWKIWTAKEAILKRRGSGLADLSGCDVFGDLRGICLSWTVAEGYVLCLAETET